MALAHDDRLDGTSLKGLMVQLPHSARIIVVGHIPTLLPCQVRRDLAPTLSHGHLLPLNASRHYNEWPLDQNLGLRWNSRGL